jgi:hypothetical protein
MEIVLPLIYSSVPAPGECFVVWVGIPLIRNIPGHYLFMAGSNNYA